MTSPHLPAAPNAPSSRTGLVGVLVPVIYDLYFSAMLSGIAEATYQHEMRLVLSPTLHEHAREISLLDRLMRGMADGAVVVLPEASSDELERELNDQHPFVVLDPLLPLSERIPLVVVANRSGADQATRHLLSLGHRRIAAITGPPGWVCQGAPKSAPVSGSEKCTTGRSVSV